MTPDYLPLAPPVSEPSPLPESKAESDAAAVHVDYDRRPLVVEHFEHYVDVRVAYSRFRIG